MMISSKHLSVWNLLAQPDLARDFTKMFSRVHDTIIDYISSNNPAIVNINGYLN